MKKGNPVFTVIIGIILAIMLFFLLYTIYCVVYKASRDSDFAFLGGYTTFVNQEDNMAPEYGKNDLILVKEETYYTTSQVVLYKYNTSYRLGTVCKTSTSKYYMGNSMNTAPEDQIIVESTDVLGSAYKNFGAIGGIFNFLMSPMSMVITAVLFLLFIAFTKEK